MAIVYDGKLCVEASELIRMNDKTGIGSEKGFMAEGTYYSKVHRGLIIVARRGCKGTPTLIEFETMDDKTKRQYVSAYGDPRDVPEVRDENNAVIRAMESGDKAMSYFMRFRSPDGYTLDKKKIDLYVLQARILDACLKIAHRKKNDIGQGATRFNVWDALSELVNDMATIRTAKGEQKYPHCLPSNGKSLKRKAERYAKEGPDSLINKNFGNKSASKVNTKESEAVMHKLIAQHMNLNNMQIMTFYNQIAGQLGLPLIQSPATVDAYKKRMESTTLAHRRGVEVYKNRLEMQIKRSAPETAMTYWTLDGWTLELLYEKKEIRTRIVKGKEQKYRTTTTTNRKTVVVVLDACCKYPIGYAVGEHENTSLIRQALRNAVNHTKEIFGNRYHPVQLQSDNYQKKRMVPFYEAISKCYTNAALHNAKAKIIEPYFKYLNTNYCQLKPNWSGFGVTSRRELQPNLEILNRNRSQVPDESVVMAQIEDIMAKERELKIDMYMKAWENTPADRRLLFTDEEYLLLMGETTGFSNRLTGEGLRIELAGERLYFDSFDASLREHYNEDWMVRYDPEDLSKVLITNCEASKGHRVVKETGSLRYVMERKTIIPMALVDQKEEHYEHLRRVRQYNKEMEQRYIEANEERDRTLKNLVERIPQILHAGILEKSMIVDNMGQHKDRRTEERERDRIYYEDADIIDEDNVPGKPTPNQTADDDEDYEWDPTDMNFSR